MARGVLGMGRITKSLFERWTAASWLPLVICGECGHPTEAGVFADDHVEAMHVSCACARPAAIP